MYNEYFSKKISSLKKQNLYRNVNNHIINNNYVSFCSNDYLGLKYDFDIQNQVIKTTKSHGFGSCASRYIYSNTSLLQKLEKKLSDIKKTKQTIVFGSGYLAGVGTIPALVNKKDLIVADKLIHSCLIDGAKLSGAKLFRFRHNDIDHCLNILIKNRNQYNKCIIITETVFSMNGNLGKIQKLLDLALRYNCILLSDDAHGLGVVKSTLDLDKYKEIYLQLGTLSKAVAGYGGYVSGADVIIDYLRNFAKTAIYSTSLPASIIAGNIKSLEKIEKDKILYNKVLNNVKLFCNILKISQVNSAIVAIIVGKPDKALEIANKIRLAGYLVSAIRPPTVEQNKSRIRITFSALHKANDIEKLANILLKLTT